MLTCIQTTVTFIMHSVISKQKIPSKEGEEIAVNKAAKLSIKITDKELLNTPEDNGIVQQNSEAVKTRYG